MALTAEKLSKSGARGKEIDLIIREQLQMIDDRLLRAERKWGRNVVTHDLPIQFTIPGLEKKDAQRIVYSSILRSLERRKFEVCLCLEENRSTLYIAWVTDLDVDEVEAMNALILSKRIQPEQVPQFMTSGLIPASRTATAVRRGDARPPPPMKITPAQRTMETTPRDGVMPVADGRLRPKPAQPSKAERELLEIVGDVPK